MLDIAHIAMRIIDYNLTGATLARSFNCRCRFGSHQFARSREFRSIATALHAIRYAGDALHIN